LFVAQEFLIRRACFRENEERQEKKGEDLNGGEQASGVNQRAGSRNASYTGTRVADERHIIRENEKITRGKSLRRDQRPVGGTGARQSRILMGKLEMRLTRPLTTLERGDSATSVEAAKEL